MALTWANSASSSRQTAVYQSWSTSCLAIKGLNGRGRNLRACHALGRLAACASRLSPETVICQISRWMISPFSRAIACVAACPTCLPHLHCLLHYRPLLTAHHSPRAHLVCIPRRLSFRYLGAPLRRLGHQLPRCHPRHGFPPFRPLLHRLHRHIHHPSPLFHRLARTLLHL